MAFKIVQSERDKLYQEYKTRTKQNFTEVDQTLRKSLGLTIVQYAIVDEIFRKQNLKQRQPEKSGWCWQSRKEIAKRFYVHVDIVDWLVRKRPDLVEQNNQGWLRVTALWRPNKDQAKKEKKLSTIYHGLGNHWNLTPEEQAVLSLIGNYQDQYGTQIKNKEIERRLAMSKVTVIKYVRNLVQKEWIEYTDIAHDTYSGNQKRLLLPLTKKNGQGKQVIWNDIVESWSISFGKEQEWQRDYRLAMQKYAKEWNMPGEEFKQPKKPYSFSEFYEQQLFA